MDDLSTWQLALAGLATTVGALVQGSVGFGSSLIAAPLLALVDPGFIPGPMLAANLLLTGLVTLRERHGIDLSGVGWALLGRVPGTLAAAAILLVLPRGSLSRLFALLVLLAVGLSVSGLRVRPTRPALVTAGVLSGLMGTLSSIGGPPIALVYQHAAAQKLRGTLSGYFTVAASMSIVALVLTGSFGTAELRATAPLLPGVLLGFGLSFWTRNWLRSGYTRVLVLSLSSAAAISLLLK